MAHLTTYLDLESLNIWRSGFEFKSNLTSAIGDLANHNILASYVSRPNAMAYDKLPTSMESKDDVNWYLPTHMKLMIEQIYVCEFVENNCDIATCTVNMNWQNSYKQVLTKRLN